MLMLDEATMSAAKIKVVGVGGAGGNALNSMMEEGVHGVDFIAANSDFQVLNDNRSPFKLQLGESVTHGLGAGGDPRVGQETAEASADEIRDALDGADMVFLAAGMGGGTGTGAAPVIARIAKELGALTVAVVTKPFLFEGKRRKDQADQGIADLRRTVDTLITIPNHRLLDLGDKSLTWKEALRRADATLVNAVRGITDLIHTPGLVNLDFKDVQTIMSEGGMALMGTGSARGDNRAVEAAKLAIRSPLLEDIDIKGATAVLLNIAGGDDLTLFDVNEAATLIHDEAHEDVHVIFGTVCDPSLRDEVRVTVIATGFDRKIAREIEPAEAEPMRARPVNRSLRPVARALEASVAAAAAAPTAERAAAVAGGGVDEAQAAGGLAEAEAVQAAVVNASSPVKAASLTPNERMWDVPTFLRRRRE